MALILGPPTPEKFLEARRHVQNALKLDQIPEALANLADWLVSDYLNKYNNTTIADVDAAEGLIAAALFIDSNVWMAYYARGFTNSVRGQHQASFNDFEKVTQLNGAWKGRAYAQMGNQKLFLGDPEQAVQYGLQAIQVSPKDPSIGVFNWVVGRAYFSLPAPDYVNAVKYLYQSVQDRPNLWFSQAWLIAAYWLKADKTNAQAALTQFQTAFPGYTLQWITDYYATETRYQNPTIQTAVKTMLQALQDAGLR
jgi:tetratricopeptide (TPR) repeat protein